MNSQGPSLAAQAPSRDSAAVLLEVRGTKAANVTARTGKGSESLLCAGVGLDAVRLAPIQRGLAVLAIAELVPGVRQAKLVDAVLEIAEGPAAVDGIEQRLGVVLVLQPGGKVPHHVPLVDLETVRQRQESSAVGDPGNGNLLVQGDNRCENTTALEPVFDPERPIVSTGDMRPWWTGKPCEHTKRSHINFCVFDSTWEASEAFELDRNKAVASWVKNDHLGFEVIYVYRGAVRKYRPDFLIRLANGTMLVLEVKGRDSQEDKAKRQFLAEWVEAVNTRGGSGRWARDVSFSTDDLSEALFRHGGHS
jgi:hypothetical protein